MEIDIREPFDPKTPEEEAAYDAIRVRFLHTHYQYLDKLFKWCDQEDPYPGPNWSKEVDYIVTGLLSFRPLFFPDDTQTVESVRELFECKDPEGALAFATMLKGVILEWIHWRGPASELLKRLRKHRDSATNCELNDTLLALGSPPAVSASQLVNNFKGEPVPASKVAKMLRDKGYDRRRVSNKGESQYLWVLTSDPEISKMSNQDLKKFWEGLNNPNKISFL